MSVQNAAGARTGEVELWQIRLDAVDADAVDVSVLDESEHERLGRLVLPADRLRYGAAHVALRRLLAVRLGVGPETVTFGREPCPGCGGPHGRPAVHGIPGAPHFSLSHSGDSVLIGMAAWPVGVDVEEVPREATVHSVTPLLHPLEQAEIREDPRPREAFARVWSRKEAYLKGVGIGVARSLDRDYVGERRPDALPDGWHVSSVSAAEGHAAAVAVAAAGPVLRMNRLEPGFVTKRPAVRRS
ncbi:4'-phosphopantetheinyl transferase superfamily protein [Streptomyces sp. NPDC002825]|uniref:4'-phosphopantetheinyl transferase family protein n=1 Tax=Streptomyces sp. NPDC002825 TaxID=3154666 RepID=UPI0033192EC1